MTAPTLFVPPPADGNLTDRQKIALDILERGPAGVRAFDVGVELHQALNKPCPCGPGHACKWAAADALQVLRALKQRGLARLRRGGIWQHHAATGQSAGRADSRPRSTYDPATARIPF